MVYNHLIQIVVIYVVNVIGVAEHLILSHKDSTGRMFKYSVIMEMNDKIHIRIGSIILHLILLSLTLQSI